MANSSRIVRQTPSKGTRTSSTAEVRKSSRSTAQLRAQYERVAKAANKRLEKLKEAGFGSSEFVQNHKNGFKTDIMYDQYGRVRSRTEVSKMLAEVNRFMNAESSTVRGLKKARQELLDSLHDVDEEGNPTRYEGITEENLDKFTKFMDMYHSSVEAQTNYSSETAVQAFILGEKLHISQKDLLKNMDRVYRNYEQLESLDVSMLIGDESPGRKRFSFSDYEKAAERRGIIFF